MTQLNTTSNFQATEGQSFTGSLYPTNSLQTEPNDLMGYNPKHPMKPRSSSKKTMENSSVGSLNVKRLADMLDPQENTSKMNMKGTLSDAFNNSSFYSPAQTTTLQTKSIRQKISNMKPATANYNISREEANTSKVIDSTGIILDRVPRNSNSPPQREMSQSILAKHPIETQLPNRSSQGSSPRETSNPKIKHINTIYRNQSILDHLRKSRASLNTSSSKAELHHFSHSTKAAWTSAGFPTNVPVTNNTESSLKIVEPTRHQSIGECQLMDKGMLLNFKHRRNSSAKNLNQNSVAYPERVLPKKSRQSKVPGGFNNSNNSINTSFNGLTKDFNTSSQINISVEKTHGISGNLMSQLFNGENNYSEINRTESIENKLEGLLVNKSTEPQQLEEINALFDNFTEIVCETGNVKEGQKVRSMLRKIKLAYGIFFQNYSHGQNKKLAQAKEYQQRLEKDCEVMELKLSEMNTEIESLQKDNERLLLQNKIPKNTSSPASSLTTVNKYNQVESEESPPGTKNGNANFAQSETFTSIIADQQNTINAMKRKEAKLVRLLYACKQKGLDIEQIYYEDVKSSGGQNYSDREEENIPTVNKVSMMHQIHPNFDQNNFYHMQEGQYYPSQDGGNYLEESDRIDSRSAADSDIYEKYSNYDHCEDIVQRSNIDPTLQDKLRLDFSQLNQPKPLYPMEFAIHDQKLNMDKIGKNGPKPKIQGLALNLNIMKKNDEEEEQVGFHEEFMSRMDEFSVSWRQAALKERKIP